MFVNTTCTEFNRNRSENVETTSQISIKLLGTAQLSLRRLRVHDTEYYPDQQEISKIWVEIIHVRSYVKYGCH
jgi:hypothetical protein